MRLATCSAIKSSRLAAVPSRSLFTGWCSHVVQEHLPTNSQRPLAAGRMSQARPVGGCAVQVSRAARQRRRRSGSKGELLQCRLLWCAGAQASPFLFCPAGAAYPCRPCTRVCGRTAAGPPHARRVARLLAHVSSNQAAGNTAMAQTASAVHIERVPCLQVMLRRALACLAAAGLLTLAGGAARDQQCELLHIGRVPCLEVTFCVENKGVALRRNAPAGSRLASCTRPVGAAQHSCCPALPPGPAC